MENYNTTGVESDNSILNIINIYGTVIDKFKKTNDVNIGEIGFKRDGVNVQAADRPASQGHGFGLTGYCVSASRALLEWEPFQMLLNHRDAKAKLISIDIKEQYYGKCYNGSQNYWHTAILVADWLDGQRYNFIIDVTVRQFGDAFVGKDFWNFEVWMKKLRADNCTHDLYDFDGKSYKIVPENISQSVKQYKDYSDIDYLLVKDALKRNITLNNDDRNQLTDFLFNKLDFINQKILTGNIDTNDFEYIKTITDKINRLYFSSSQTSVYSILKFRNGDALINWIAKFNEDNLLPQYTLVFDSINKACDYYNIDTGEINQVVKSPTSDVPFYLMLEFKPGNVFPVVESKLIKGFVLFNSLFTDVSISNTAEETEQPEGIQKTFNTIKLVLE